MFKLFKRLTSKEIGLILMTVVFICLTVYLELEVPTYMSEITTLLQTPGTTTGDLWVPGLKMLGLSFASLFSLVIAGFVDVYKRQNSTFAELLNKQRIKAAQQLLLSTNDSIEDVCYAVGYSNVGYFYKVFRKLCGKSPKAYRQQVD